MFDAPICWRRLLGASLGLGLASLACGGGADDTTPSGGAAGAVSAATAGMMSNGGAGAGAGATGGAAQASAGSPSGNLAGTGGVSVSAGGGGGGAGDANASGNSGTGGAAGGTSGPVLTSKDFACTELVGLWVASQWWDSFEKGVDNVHWQFTFQHHGYLELFADPASPYWANAVSSKCTTGAAMPDRVVFLPFSLSLNTLEQWTTNLTQLVATMKTKFPGLKRIELMTTLRSPGNMPCANDTDPNTVVPPYVDQAIETVAAGSGGLVTVGPKIELTNCDWWAGGTDLTGAGNTGAGQLLATYYQAH
jgi:hypothetical protein